MRSLYQIVFTVATLAASSAADAKPRRVVILDFEGPRILADSGRSAVLNVLGDQYDVVSTKRWESARMQAAGRGPQQWSVAAKSAGVDAIVEGWVDPEGMRTHTMTIAVRDASTGREVDSFTVKISDKGVSTDTTRTLTEQFDDILAWVDGDPTGEGAKANYIDIRTERPTLGSHVAKVEPEGDDDDDDDDDDDTGEVRRTNHRHHERDRSRHHRGHDSQEHSHHHRSHEKDVAVKETESDKPEKTEKADVPEKSDKETSTDETKPAVKQVATTDLPAGVSPDTVDLINIFGPKSKDAGLLLDDPTPRHVRLAPRFAISAGGFVASRGMSFTQNPPDFPADPPSYPATGLYGLAFEAAVYPRPLSKYSEDLTGIGFTFQLQQSVGAELDANDTVMNTYGSYDLNYTQYEGAIHYRYPMGIVMLDGQVNYGRDSWTLEGDFPASVQIPDTSYSYLGVGGDIELAVTDRTRVGFGARYMYILSAGDVSDETWYGSGDASGLELNLNFQVPLGDLLYLKGMFEYRRISMDFEGDGNLSVPDQSVDGTLAVSNIVDSSIGGNVQIGVKF
jgi:hypothetical protein